MFSQFLIKIVYQQLFGQVFLFYNYGIFFEYFQQFNNKKYGLVYVWLKRLVNLIIFCEEVFSIGILIEIDWVCILKVLLL